MKEIAIKAETENKKSMHRNSLVMILAGTFLIALSGWLSAEWRAKNADAEIRESLLLQAVQIARAIDPELVQKLTFTASDKGTLSFERICKQMTAYGQIISQRGIYSMALRNGNLTFGPENYPENDPMASPPGTIFQEPVSEDFEIFAKGKAVTIGPATDEYGTFISALAPVHDPRTGDVLMVVGIDFLSDDWENAIHAARRGPLAITLVIVMVLSAGTITIFRRNQHPERQGVLLRHIETGLVALLGLILTFAATFLALEYEKRSLSRIFTRNSHAMAEAVSDAFQDIKNNIAAIKRFSEGSDHVNMHEFIVFAEPMTRTSAVESYQMASFVPLSDKDHYEAKMIADGIEDFVIWEQPSKNKRISVAERSVYYPVCYVAPWNNHHSDVGFDLGSRPNISTAIEKSIQTGFAMAANPINLTHDDSYESKLLIIQAIFREDNQYSTHHADGKSEKFPHSFAVGIIRIESMLDVVLKKYSNEEWFVNLHLVDLADKQDPALLAAYPHEHMANHPAILDKQYFQQYDYIVTHPVFTFGHPLAIVSHPTDTFYEIHPLRESLLVGCAGLLLTIVFTLVTGLWRNRHLYLESQVIDRTRALQESEKQFRVLFENAISGVSLHEIISDEHGNPVDYIFLQANPGFEKHTGLKTENILGKRATNIFGGIEKAPFIEIFGNVALDGEPVTFETYFEPLKRHLIINAYQVGERRFATTFLDITQQKRSEKEKTKLQTQLAQAQKMEAVGRLAGGVAHDFNNMLSVILGFTEMASEKLEKSHPVQEDLQEVIFAGTRSSNLVRQLMAFARRQTANPEVLDLNECIAGMLKMLRRLIGEDVHLAWIPGYPLWEVKIDPSQLDQLLANLMVNARDAIESHGNVTIETHNMLLDEDFCKYHAGSIPGKYVMMAVSDDGCGMDKETQANIFEPFFTTKEVGKGTGLGLSTVFGIIKQNKGYINVYSEPGQGTTFRIYLPRFDGKTITKATMKPKPGTRTDNKTLLMVEDEKALLKLSKTMLEQIS